MKKSEFIERNIQYLRDKVQEDGVFELGDGVLARIVKSGEGTTCPTLKNVVTVYYTGMLINGKVFDTNRRGGAPSAFRLRELIKGWQIGLTEMKVGDQWKLFIPSELGYGKRGAGIIPGGATLIFDIELVGIS